ncbi:hypothetical protein FOZ63_017134, partial [Perkinsus olseni]
SPQRGGAYERQHAALNEQLRILQAKDQPWEVTVFEATALSNARLRWSSLSSPSTTPWDLAHTYPYMQSVPTFPTDIPPPSARVSDFLLHQWEEGREKTRRKCGDTPHRIEPGSVTYIVKPRRSTKLGSQVVGPYRVLWVTGNTAHLQATTGRDRSVFAQPVDNLVRSPPTALVEAKPTQSSTSSGPPDPAALQASAVCPTRRDQQGDSSPSASDAPSSTLKALTDNSPADKTDVADPAQAQPTTAARRPYPAS